MTLRFDDKRELYASATFLRGISPVFDAMLSSDFKERSTGVVELKHKRLEDFLAFLHLCHHTEYEPVTGKSALYLCLIRYKNSLVYSTDNVFVVILFVYRTYTCMYRWYFYRISLVRKWYYIIVSHIVFLISQLTDGTVQTNDLTIGFVEEVAVIWHVNITKSYRISHTV